MSFIEIPRTQKPPLGVPLDFGNDLTRGILAYFAFNESGGDTIYDLSGGYHGTWNGSGERWVAGSASFDGSSNYIVTEIMPVTPEFTLVARVKSDLIDHPGYNRIIENLFSNAWYLGTDAIGTGYHLIVNNDLFGDTTGGTMTKKWQYIVGTFDGVTGVLYVDGQIVGSPDTFTAPTPSTDDVYIGRNSAGGSFWTGDIDQVIIYDRNLTASEVTDLTANPWQLHEPILIPFVEAAAAGVMVAMYYRSLLQGDRL